MKKTTSKKKKQSSKPLKKINALKKKKTKASIKKVSKKGTPQRSKSLTKKAQSKKDTKSSRKLLSSAKKKSQAQKKSARSASPISYKERKTSSRQIASEGRKISELKRELEDLNKRVTNEPLIKDAEGRLYCQHETCDQPAVTGAYCRYHYLALWKYLHQKKTLIENNYLRSSIKDLVKTFGESCLQVLLRDFKNEKVFESVAREMQMFSSKDEDLMDVDKNEDY